MLPRTLTFCALLLAAPALASAQVVGIDCTGDLDTGAHLAAVLSTDVMGLIPQQNWNSTGEGVQIGSLTGLVDHRGVLYAGASASWDFNGDGDSQNVPDATPNPVDRNHKLMGGLLWDNTGGGTLSVSGLDDIYGAGEAYDVYVYMDAWALGTPPHDHSVQLNGLAPLAVSLDADYSEPGAAFDDATIDGAGNYVVFEDVIGDSFTLSLLPGVSAGTAWLNGVQILGVASGPPVAPATDSLGIDVTGNLSSASGAKLAAVEATDTMGVVPQAHWNPTGEGVRVGTLIGLSGASGFVYPDVRVDWSFSEDGHSQNLVDATPEPVDKNHKLMAGLLWDSLADPTLSVSGLDALVEPGGSYDVIVYMDAWALGTPPPHTQALRLGADPPAGVTLDADYSEPAPAFDDASFDGAGNTYRFTGVSGDAFTLTLERGASAGVAWLNGVQIVVPPPAPKVPALGSLGVWALVSAVLALGALRSTARARRGTRSRS